jgi:hypothetical protein
MVDLVVTWIVRPADHRVAALLDASGEAARVVTVHGFGGTGKSALVVRALGERRFRRIDARAGLTSAVRAQLATPTAANVLTFLDQVVDPRPFRALLAQPTGQRRVIVAARAPLGIAAEHQVSVGMLDEASTRELVAAELFRLGAPSAEISTALLAAVDGWPLAALAVARHARTFGTDEEDFDAVVAQDPACEAVARATWSSLGERARSLAVVLAVAGAPVALREIARSMGARACTELDARGVLVPGEHGVRLVRAFADFVRRSAPAAAVRRARARRVQVVLRTAEAANARFRRAPAAAGKVLRQLDDELWQLALSHAETAPRLAVRAALALEPLAVGKLERERVLALGAAALGAAERLGRRARNAVRLAHVRALIARGDHESAAALLAEPELLRDPESAMRTLTYRAHVAAWRDDLDEADALLAEATRRIPRGARTATVLDAQEDLLVQRTFVAFRRADLGETERLARRCAAGVRRRPSPRVVAIARRFMAEVQLARGRAHVALPLFERSRSELFALGDEAGALFLSTRIVAALRAAGDEAGATVEAHAVARTSAQADEPAFEVATLETRSTVLARGRVEELAWRAQIPSVRAGAERWLAENGPRSEALTLRVDVRARRAALGERTMDLGRRGTLWRILRALVDAHDRLDVLDAEALFRTGWPGDRAASASRRKRVQTAIWALRRGLLGDALESRPEGYALEPGVGVSVTPRRA